MALAEKPQARRDVELTKTSPARAPARSTPPGSRGWRAPSRMSGTRDGRGCGPDHGHSHARRTSVDCQTPEVFLRANKYNAGAFRICPFHIGDALGLGGQFPVACKQACTYQAPLRAPVAIISPSWSAAPTCGVARAQRAQLVRPIYCAARMKPARMARTQAGTEGMADRAFDRATQPLKLPALQIRPEPGGLVPRPML